MQLLDTLSSFFISNAYADTAAAPAQQGSFMSLAIIMGVFVVFMYFAAWRPQNKRAKEQRDLLNSLAKGDEVVAAGGILGTISKLTDHYIVLTLANNVELTVRRSSVMSTLPKGTLKSI